jgi:Ca2+-binding EF-hand superfamily protein
METLGLKPNQAILRSRALSCSSESTLTVVGFVQEELDSMIREIDQDGNGEIDFDEFVHVMSRKVQPTYTPDEVKAAFKVFETPNAGLPAGFVKTQALEKALTTYGTEKLTLEEAQDLLQQVDPENAGSINYVEYVNMMCST